MLDWCKLFGEAKPRRKCDEPAEYGHGHHGWRNIASDVAMFQRGLLTAAEMSEGQFEALIETMRSVRDKFIAHLDLEKDMHFPMLAPAHRAVAFYHAHVVTSEQTGVGPLGLPETPEQFEVGFNALRDDTLAIMKSFLE